MFFYSSSCSVLFVLDVGYPAAFNRGNLQLFDVDQPRYHFFVCSSYLSCWIVLDRNNANKLYCMHLQMMKNSTQLWVLKGPRSIRNLLKNRLDMMFTKNFSYILCDVILSPFGVFLLLIQSRIIEPNIFPNRYFVLLTRSKR